MFVMVLIGAVTLGVAVLVGFTVAVIVMKREDRAASLSRTAPTVFDRAWREPVNLKKIGDEGGVVPILVRHASRQVTRAARSLPGWRGPDQPARARAAPLDEAQLLRAAQAHEAQEAQAAAPR